MAERFIGWLVKIIRPNWVTVVLMFTLLSLLVYSIQVANWVREESALSSALLLGILFGYLLARSRFAGWFVLPYSLVISVVISVQSVGNILPSLSSFFVYSPGFVFDQMNLRILGFYLRLTGWVNILQSGENIQDSGIFVLLLGAILALAGIWLMWCLVRKRNVLAGLFPLGLLFAINVHMSRQPLTSYMVFLFCSVLLVARSSFNWQHEEWQRRKVDYPEQLGLEWGGAALALALLIVLAARAAPLFGTSEGWRAISDLVARMHEQTSTTATRLFSGVNPPPPPPDEEKVTYVNTPNLGEIGSPIAQGDETIMWVKISDPPPMPVELRGNIPSLRPVYTHYWRNEIYGAYTGRGWRPAPLAGQMLQQEPLPETPPPGRYFLRQDIQILAKHDSGLFSASDPVQSGPGARLRSTTVDGSRLVEGQVSDYQVISAATRISATRLAESPTDYPAEIRAMYLQLPDSLPARVRTLANRIVAPASDPFHKAQLIQNFLRDNYTYNLTVPEAPAGRDVVDYFLFDAPGGFCSHYASAMAVMLRAVGVPARVTSGYAMGDYDPDRGAYRVPASAAHAWVEVYFTGYGWVEFEPTVGRSAIQYSEEAPSAQLTPVQVPGLEEGQPGQVQPLFILLVLAGALVLLALPFLLMRFFSASRQPPVIQVDVLYRRIRRALAWAGLGALASVTPDEYLALYSGHLDQYERLQKALRQTTILYRETVYSPRLPEAHRVRNAAILWQQSFNEWLALWLRATWQKLRSRVAA